MKHFSKNKLLIKKTIKLYPLFWPRLYSTIRSLILPVSEIESLLPKTGSVLDVGCGYGFTSIFFALKNSKRQIFASEINTKRIILAKKISSAIPNLSFETSDLINQRQPHFDAILAIDLLHHLSPRQKNSFLKSSFSKLNSNSVLIIKDINSKPLLKYLWNYLHDLVVTRFSRLYFLSPMQMKELLVKNHFRIIKQGKYRHIFYPHVYYVCQKKS